MSAAGFWAWWGWGRCAFVARVADIARCLERARRGIEALLDPIFMSPATWWVVGWVRSPERWWS